MIVGRFSVEVGSGVGVSLGWGDTVGAFVGIASVLISPAAAVRVKDAWEICLLALKIRTKNITKSTSNEPAKRITGRKRYRFIFFYSH